MNKPVKVLLVEDSEDDAKMALRALRRGGFEPTHRRVQTAADLKSALAGERWDAVISDFQMPGFTGMDALEIFRSSGLDIPFILVSGTIGEEIAVEAMKAGANDYLMKKSLVRLAPALERELNEAQMRAAHRRMQESLTESEERFRQMAENIRDMFFLRDAHSGRVLYVSPAYEEIWGRSRESLYADPQSRIEEIHQEDRASAGEKFKQGMTSGKYEFEYRIVRPDGSIRWIETRGYPVCDAAGKLIRIAGVAKDITERKRSEEELLRFRAAMDATADAIVLVNRSSMHFIEVNAAACSMLGYGREELLQIGPADLAAAPLEQVTAVHDAIIAGHGTNELAETRLRCKDGSHVQVEIHRNALRSGAEWIVVGVLRDITERKQAENRLRESERRFSDLLGNVALISLMRDREGRITYCNEYLLHLSGWRYAEVIGQNWIERFIPPGIVDDKKEFFAALLADRPEARHHESEILTRAGKRRLIRWNNTLLRSASGDVTGTASIGEDITEQKRAELAIKRLNRVYAVLSGINALIVRVHERDELFREACRIAVGQGGFHMAMIGIVDRSTMRIVPAASAGVDDELLRAVNAYVASGAGVPDGQTTFARAIRERRALVSNVSPENPTVMFGRKSAGSTAVLPLIVADEAVGVLALYTEEAGFFDGEELQLLTELAGDIAFALDHIEKAEKLKYFAYYDVLTGLANRSLFVDRVAQYLRSAASGGYKLAVLMFDLERFKNINDSLGRPAGDALLQQVAAWLTRNAEDANLVARVGADHFATVLPRMKQEADVARRLDKMMEEFLEHPFRLNDAVFRIAAKVGIALFPDDGSDADTLFRNAEAALKKAKASGERYLFYTQAMTAAVAGKLTLENQLRQALDNEEFVLHYQPKVSLASSKVTGAEALIRWNDPRTGVVPPGQFIPVLEETGLIYEVGRWALRQAIEDYLRWRRAGRAAVRIAVNVSPLQLRHRGFIAEIGQVISVDAQAAASLELEITEGVIMEDVKHNIASLQAIRALGVTIAIDDFGTGFSSLSYLAKLPVDTLKIDRSFVIDMTAGPEGLALVSTIISLAHALKLKVVAEGVETGEQSRLLRLLSCDEMQGFVFSKAVPAQIFEEQFLAPRAG